MTRLAILASAATLLAAGPSSARDVHDIAFRPDVFADYLSTGQTPRPAVARIVSADASGTSIGSGVLVDVNATQGLVLTNWHVVRESRGPVLVQFPDGFQSAGTVLRQDADWDLAVLVIWRPNVEPVSIAPASPAIAEPLTIAGYGRGHYREQTGPCTQYLSPGSGLPLELVELAATARQGDSGGPIFNASGELAGVLFGQGDGRTVGSCSGRVRQFLTAVGSSGFDKSRFRLVSSERQSLPQAAAPPTAAIALGPPLASVIPETHAIASPAADILPPDIVARLAQDPAETLRLALSAVGAVTLVALAIRALAPGGSTSSYE